MIFNDAELCDACQLRVFIDADEDTRFMRRLSRDTDDGVGGRGRSVESVFRQWSDVVKPAHAQYVEPTKRYAHMVVPSRGLKVPTHLHSRVTSAAEPASVSEPSEVLVDGMMLPALQLIEAYVKQRCTAEQVPVPKGAREYEGRRFNLALFDRL